MKKILQVSCLWTVLLLIAIPPECHVNSFDLVDFLRDSLNSITDGISELIDSVCVYHNPEFSKCPRPEHPINAAEGKSALKVACCEYFALLDCAEGIAQKHCDDSAVETVQNARAKLMKQECKKINCGLMSASLWWVWLIVGVLLLAGVVGAFLYYRRRKYPNTKLFGFV